ncbi:hypothetical protein [Novosphingobium sp. MBES04]|uniref:hypothetical protein n=1 Tax=Novosphingobium sp. MBES04 TaxID=1206458 RepID=UPI00057EB618|nr:hypothetical protein [Novosphingobium sp. MBES04]GAM04768.1 hypothetical protein MBENS4_1766 [Novosphingobium sp. MBES04]
MTLPKKMIVRDMTLNEISSVDVPAVKGATALILKSGAAAFRKNVSEVATGEAAPLYKAAEYADATMVRAGEIALKKGCTPGKALLESEGPHNRLCHPCAHLDVSPYAL